MSGYPQDAFTLVSADNLDFVHGHARVYCKCKKSGNHCGPGCACLSCNVPASITQEVMEIEVTETVNQESDITDSDLEDVDDIMHSVFGDDEGADMDRSYDSEASSGDEGNSNDEANSDDDPMDVDSNV